MAVDLVERETVSWYPTLGVVRSTFRYVRINCLEDLHELSNRAKRHIRKLKTDIEELEGIYAQAISDAQIENKVRMEEYERKNKEFDSKGLIHRFFNKPPTPPRINEINALAEKTSDKIFSLRDEVYQCVSILETLKGLDFNYGSYVSDEIRGYPLAYRLMAEKQYR